MLNDMEKVELSKARSLPTESLQSRSDFFFFEAFVLPIGNRNEGSCSWTSHSRWWEIRVHFSEMHQRMRFFLLKRTVATLYPSGKLVLHCCLQNC